MQAVTCQRSEHRLSRRSLLGGLLAGGAAVALSPQGLSPQALAQQAVAERLQAAGKRLILITHDGGLSQLESWDPKPHTDTGGPHLPIATSVPGIAISELMPNTARQVHHLTIHRGLSTGDNNHGPAQTLMLSGRREGGGLLFPHIGCVAQRYLTPAEHPVPGFIAVGVDGNPAFLGAQYAAVKVTVDKPPANLALPAWIAAAAEERRQALRRRMNDRFAQQRGAAETAAYALSFEQGIQLMGNKRLFDLDQEPARDRQRYGTHELGRGCLLARRLIEHGVTCVRVGHSGYDTHAENFNVHLDLLQQFDQPFACLIEDLAERGMLDDTLVVAMGEFGRTPGINTRMGRDHWSASWSAAFAGPRFPRGIVYGATSANGTEVTEGLTDAGALFHTMLTALGIDSRDHYVVGGQEIPIADPACAPVEALLRG